MGFEAFKQSGHAESTQVVYDGVWHLWCECLTALEVQGGRREIEQYLTNVKGATDKCYIWEGFVYHLRGKKGVLSQRIASQLAAVRHKLSMRLTDLSFMEKHNGSVQMALLAAAKKSKGEILATLRKNQRMMKRHRVSGKRRFGRS